MVVDSPPGTTSARQRARSCGVRTATTGMRSPVAVVHDSRATMCSANEPWRALWRVWRKVSSKPAESSAEVGEGRAHRTPTAAGGFAAVMLGE